MVLLDTGTPGTSREIFSEDADGKTRTRIFFFHISLVLLSYRFYIGIFFSHISSFIVLSFLYINTQNEVVYLLTVIIL